MTVDIAALLRECRDVISSFGDHTGTLQKIEIALSGVTDTTEAMRAAFEKCVADQGYDISKDVEGDYKSIPSMRGWWLWQAALASQQVRGWQEPTAEQWKIGERVLKGKLHRGGGYQFKAAVRAMFKPTANREGA